MPESFIPLTLQSASGREKRSFQAVHSGNGKSATVPAADGATCLKEPIVSLQIEGEVIKKIIVTCACGQVMELEIT